MTVKYEFSTVYVHTPLVGGFEQLMVRQDVMEELELKPYQHVTDRQGKTIIYKNALSFTREMDRLNERAGKTLVNTGELHKLLKTKPVRTN